MKSKIEMGGRKAGDDLGWINYDLESKMPVMLRTAVFLLLMLYSVNSFGQNADPKDSSLNSNADQEVTIQFKWLHQFQFAGYYAAKEKGFFAEEGLKVSLRQRDIASDSSHIDDVINGGAEYGIADAGLILSHLQGKPVVLLSQIFQHSPLVLLALKESNIKTPYDLVGKKVMADLQGNSNAPVNAMLQNTLGGLHSIEIVPHSYRNADLLDGKIDAMIGYKTNEPYWLYKQNQPVSILDPRDYGVDFYGDNLFTTKQEIEAHPQRVEKIIRSVKRGWEYALTHPEEIVDLILAKYNTQNHTRDHLLYEANQTKGNILSKFIEIGKYEPSRYTKIAETYALLGFVDNSRVDPAFFYAKQKNSKALATYTQTSNRIKKELHQLISAKKNTTMALALTLSKSTKVVGALKLNQPDLAGLKQLSKDLRKDTAYKNVWFQLVTKEGKSLARSWTDKKGDLVTFRPEIKKILVDKKLNSTISVGKSSISFKSMVPVFDEKEQFVGVFETITHLNSISRSLAKQGVQTIILVDKKYRKQITKPMTNRFIQDYYVANLPAQQDLLTALEKSSVKERISRIQQNGFEIDSKKQKLICYSPLLGTDNKPMAHFFLYYPLNLIKNLSVNSVPGIGLSLTEQERNWLKNHPKIRIGVMDAWPPMNFLDAAGQPRGIGADYLRLLNKKLEGQLEIVSGPFKENLNQVKTKVLDALMDVTPTREREEFFNFTRIYLNIPHVIVAPKNGPYFASEKNLIGHTLALEEGFASITFFKKKYPGVKIKTYPDTSQALRAVTRGQADAYAGNQAVAGWLMERDFITNLQFQGWLNKKGSILTIGVRKDWPLLASILNKTLAGIPVRQTVEINRRWINSDLSKKAPSRAGALKKTENQVSYELLVYGIVAFFLIGALILIFVKFLRRENIAVKFGSIWFRRLVIIGMSGFIAIVVLAGFLMLTKIKQQEFFTINGQLSEHMSALEKNIDLWLQARISKTAQISRAPKLIANVKRLLKVDPQNGNLLESDELKQVRLFFKNIKNEFPNIGFFIINRDFTSIGSMRDTNVGSKNLIAAQYPELLDRAFNGEYVFVPPMPSDVSLKEVSGGNSQKKPPTMFFLGPVQDDEGKILAVMTLHVDPLNDFALVLKMQGELSHHESYAFDETGCMLTTSSFEDELKKIGLLKNNQTSALNIRLLDPGVNLTLGEKTGLKRNHAPLTYMVLQALKQRDNAGLGMGSSVNIESTIREYRDFRGVPVFGAWFWSSELNMGVATEINVEDALAGFNQIRCQGARNLALLILGDQGRLLWYFYATKSRLYSALWLAPGFFMA